MYVLIVGISSAVFSFSISLHVELFPILDLDPPPSSSLFDRSLSKVSFPFDGVLIGPFSFSYLCISLFRTRGVLWGMIPFFFFFLRI